jgi:hypothetical protein
MLWRVSGQGAARIRIAVRYRAGYGQPWQRVPGHFWNGGRGTYGSDSRSRLEAQSDIERHDKRLSYAAAVSRKNYHRREAAFAGGVSHFSIASRATSALAGGSVHLSASPSTWNSVTTRANKNAASGNTKLLVNKLQNPLQVLVA